MTGFALACMHLGLFAVSLGGFLALALATERHAEHLLGRLPAPRWRWLARVVGWLLLAASLAWAITVLGTGIGITLWLGWLSVAALAWVFTFPWWPWQPPAPKRAPRKTMAKPSDAPPVVPPRVRRWIAAALLMATVAAYATALAQVEKQPLQSADTVNR